MSKVISISGVDGVGKSTLIKCLVKDFEQRGMNVKVLRSRPCGFPILSSIKYGKKEAEAIASSQLHFEKKQQNKLISYLKFIYYLIDYLLGNFLLFSKFTSNNNVIIFDRYYFDYICDQSRFSIYVNPVFSKFFLKMIFIPDCNFYLYSSTELIYLNRREQSENQIILSNKRYINLFRQCKKIFPSKSFHIIEGLQSNTLDEVLKCLHE